MATALPPKLYTEAEFLALPDDGKRRWLIHGELREEAMTVRNRFHAEVMMLVGHALVSWNLRQSLPRGKVMGGEAGFRLPTNPESIVGIDVAYITPEMCDRQQQSSTLVIGAPLLAVEVLSPSDTQESVQEKMAALRDGGTDVIWVVNPWDQTIIVHRSNRAPKMFNIEDTLVGDDYLPDFAVPVRELFPASST